MKLAVIRIVKIRVMVTMRAITTVMVSNSNGPSNNDIERTETMRMIVTVTVIMIVTMRVSVQ